MLQRKSLCTQKMTPGHIISLLIKLFIKRYLVIQLRFTTAFVYKSLTQEDIYLIFQQKQSYILDIKFRECWLSSQLQNNNC